MIISRLDATNNQGHRNVLKSEGGGQIQKNSYYRGSKLGHIHNKKGHFHNDMKHFYDEIDSFDDEMGHFIMKKDSIENKKGNFKIYY